MSDEAKTTKSTPNEFVPIYPTLAQYVKAEYPHLPNGLTKESIARTIQDIYLDYTCDGILWPSDTASYLGAYFEDAVNMQTDINEKLGVLIDAAYIIKTPAIDLYKKVLDVLNTSGRTGKEPAVITNMIIVTSKGKRK